MNFKKSALDDDCASKIDVVTLPCRNSAKINSPELCSYDVNYCCDGSGQIINQLNV